MKRKRKKIIFLTIITALAAVLLAQFPEFATFEALKDHRAALAGYVEEHYLLSLLAFAVAAVSTAFLVPGALLLTVGGGFLFGAALGALYTTSFSTAGAVLAFLMSRYLIGNWVQERFSPQLRGFNEEISRRGRNYLFVLRIIPVMPFFLVNYLAGLTRISTFWFTLITFCGMAPGAVVYALAGRQLAHLETPEDILSAPVLAGFSLLALFALLPTLYTQLRGILKKPP